jgi:hypothetical protein
MATAIADILLNIVIVAFVFVVACYKGKKTLPNGGRIGAQSLRLPAFLAVFTGFRGVWRGGAAERGRAEKGFFNVTGLPAREIMPNFAAQSKNKA